MVAPSGAKAGLVPLRSQGRRDVAQKMHVPEGVATSRRPAASVKTISRPLGEKRALDGRLPQVCGASHTRRPRPVWDDATMMPLPVRGVTASLPLAPGNAARAGGAV